MRKLFFFLIFLVLTISFPLVSAATGYAEIDNTNVLMLVIIFVGWGLCILSELKENFVLGVFSGLLVLIGGAYFIINGIGDYTGTFADAFSAIFLGSGAYVFIYSAVRTIGREI